MAEWVELATVWAVDLVGSTRLATSVGPLRADELRDEYFGLLREAIAGSGGKTFKNTGDGLLVAFSSASAAVSCAVLTQQLFERRYRGQEHRMRVRMGLGTGESTVKDGDYFGMPTVEATRLCDQAPTDGILVSPVTRMTAGRVQGARFESVGELALKGIPEPMEAFSVVWEPLDPERSGAEGGRWPLPEALRAVPRVAYVGRVTERGLAEHARNQARSGSRQVVLLSGEPGIGKTRLASYAALGANADGFAVCFGACSEDLAAPYEPWIDVCSQLVEHADADVLARYVERFGGEVGRLASNLGRRVPDAPAPQSSDPETERFLLFKAVAELLRVVARSVPLCVVLDDFQWADGQSVALLKHVARSVEQGQLQVLVTYRDSDLTQDHPLSAVLVDLHRLQGVDRIALRGLAVDDVAALMAAAAGHDLDQDGLALAGEIAAETDGNPFFVVEILRNLTESGMLVFDNTTGRWRVDRASSVALPASVRDVVGRRVARLGEASRQILTAAAVMGRTFDLEVVAQVLDRSEEEVLDAIEVAIESAVVVELPERVGRFAFTHALINHTLYESVTAARRARMHQRVAESLEDLYGPDSEERLAELALHWRLATVSVNREKAARYSLRAGRRALESLAPAEAVRLFGHVLEQLGSVETEMRCDALIGLGEAQRQTGDSAYRETLFEASAIASNLQDAALAARAALANNRGFVSVLGEVDRDRVAAIERALELDRPPEPNRRARLLALLAQELWFERDPTRRRALADEAVALARSGGDARTMSEVLRNALQAQWAPDTLAIREVYVRELLASADACDDPALRFWALDAACDVEVERGEISRALATIERMDAIATELDQPVPRWVATFTRVAITMGQGDLEEAERGSEAALQIGTNAGQPDATMIYAGQVGRCRRVQGRGEEIVALMEQRAAAHPDWPIWQVVLAETYCWMGRQSDAAPIVAAAAEDGFAHVLMDHTHLDSLAGYAEVAGQTGVREAAALLYELLEPYGDQFIWSGASVRGHARLYLGLLAHVLGREEPADEHFAFACEFHEVNGLLLWAARSHLGWAEALAHRGQNGRAREHAARALELSRQHGFGAFEPRAAAILDALAPAPAPGRPE